MSKASFGVALSNVKWTKYGARVRIIIFLLTCSVILLVYKSTNVSQPAKYSNTDTSSRLYTSAQHGFSVNFSGEPTVQNYSLILKHGNPDIIAPATSYKREKGNVLYAVIVCKFPSSFDGSGTDENLKVALNSMMQNPKTTRLLTSSFGQFAGYRSINGAIEVKSGETTHYIYVKFFLKDHTLYSLETVDANEAELNSFINTFRLN